MQVSVIICTHNPRPNYLNRVLSAMRQQTLAADQWELLLIDNDSDDKLSSIYDLSWHPNARHVKETERGLTPARLRGVKDSSGEFLVFVDDDNILAPDYLSTAVSIFRNWPMLGAIGASIKGEFEVAPKEWLIPHLEGLAICELDRDYWSNSEEWSRATPYGAGICVRRHIAEDYSQKVNNSQLRRLLDRSGKHLASGGDTDLAWCAIDLGLGTGRFKSLKLIHIIPPGRLSEDYIIRLKAGFAASGEILTAIRSRQRLAPSSRLKDQLHLLIRLSRTKGIQRKILLTEEKARAEARRLLQDNGFGSFPSA